MSSIELLLAVNDPDTGRHTGEVTHVHIQEVLQLEGRAITCIRRGTKVLALGSIDVVIESYWQWSGNWCWDKITISVELVPTILEELMKNDWDCLVGQTALFEQWIDGVVPTVEQLRRALLIS